MSPAERNRIQAMCRLLVDEGHMTPLGLLEIERLTDVMTNPDQEST